MPERERRYEEMPRFNSVVDRILGKKVTAKNINTFADDALIELISTVDQVVDYYGHNPTLISPTQKETEVSAFSYCGLDPVFIENALDRISEVVDGVQRLDSLIDERTVTIDEVIVPPDAKDVDFEYGNGSNEIGVTLDKLKLLLLLLQEQCSVAISDPKQLKITTGTNPPPMFRNHSYQLVQISSLQRDVLVCNEYGNATFVFDTSKYKKEGVESQDLISMSKEQIKKLQEKKGIGIVINYSDTFAERLVDALESPLSQQSGVPRTNRSVDILRPQQAPEGYLTAHGLTKKLDASYKTITTIIERLGEELGDVITYPSRGGATDYFSIEQQLLIEKALPEKAPEGYCTWTALAKTFGMTRATLITIVQKSDISLGEIREYRSNVGVSEYLSPDHQEIVAEIIPLRPPEDYLSLKGLAMRVKASPELLRGIILKNQNSIGAVETFRASGPAGLAKYYSPQQQEIIVKIVEQSPLPPEGFKTAEVVARNNDTDGATIMQIVKKYHEEIGEAKEYRSNAGLSVYYSPEQQDIIGSQILKVAPEGHRTLEGLARITKLSAQVLRRTVEMYPDEIGSGIKYRAGGRGGSADWYAPTQQELIERLAPPLPPEEYLTMRGICQKHALSQSTIEKAIQELGENLGEVGSYVSKSNTGRSFYYSPEQQELIIQHAQAIIS